MIIPIIKDNKRDVTDMENYRPIAVTCVISKILEGIILAKYGELMCTSSNQFGFKKGLSTDTCVFTLRMIIEYYQSLSSPVYAVFLDASKAFDKINHWTLFYKLLNRKVPVRIVNMMYIWYTTQNFCVRWGNVLSDMFSVTNGVRQGGIMSPMLFNLYVDNLSACLNETRTGCTFNGIIINHMMYADDTVVIAPSPHALQKLINVCEMYASANEMSYNERKSKIMCFKPSVLKNLHVPIFTLNGKCLERTDSIKYLGFIVNNDMTDDCDIVRETRSLYTRGNMILRYFSHCSRNVKILLFKTYFSCFYASHLWTMYKKASRQKFKVAYNNIFRFLFNVDKRTSVSKSMLEHSINTVDVILRKYCFSFKERLFASKNEFVQVLVNGLFFYNSRIFKRWQKDMY